MAYQGDTADETAANPMAGEDNLPIGNENNMYGDAGSQTGDGSEAPNGRSFGSGPGERNGDTPEATYGPTSGTEENPKERSETENDADDDPEQSKNTNKKEEPGSPIDVGPLIIRFVEECRKTGDDRPVTAPELYIPYLRWCDENDKLTMRQRDFGMNL